ncbi:MAG: efflux RND transporter periplasmic adaptor subunit [Candidatus Ancaeobacter aquaticus]|nr:efflux RND transporter periplasmic adaptor subunit [Candidatus Ancaeobacter aquaticus]
MKQAKKTNKVPIVIGIIIVFLTIMFVVNKSGFFQSSKEKEKLAKKEQAEKKKAPQERELPRVKAYKTSKQNYADNLPNIGTVRGSSTVNMRFETAGRVKDFNFREGDLVKKGQIIAELGHSDADLKIQFRKSKLDTAKTNLLSAGKKVEIHEKLYKANAIVKLKLDEIKLEYDRAKQALDAARIELESSNQELEKTYLHANRDGILGSKDIEPGEYVTSSVKVASLIEVKDVLIEMGIIEKDVEKIKQGLPVHVTVDAYPDREFTGEVYSIASTVQGSRTLTVKAKVPNPDILLLPGMFARVIIKVYEKDDTIVIPTSALNKGEGGYMVNVISKENKIEPREVEIGYATTDNAQIDEGLKPGELVVIDAKEKLKPETQVEVVDIQE